MDCRDEDSDSLACVGRGDALKGESTNRSFWLHVLPQVLSLLARLSFLVSWRYIANLDAERKATQYTALKIVNKSQSSEIRKG